VLNGETDTSIHSKQQTKEKGDELKHRNHPVTRMVGLWSLKELQLLVAASPSLLVPPQATHHVRQKVLVLVIALTLYIARGAQVDWQPGPDLVG
jgi:hypothetical protein